MNRLKSLLGYTWAVLALILAPTTFMGNSVFSRTLATTTGVKVSPLFSGGDVIRTIDHGDYKTAVHRPVFDALIGQTKTGFVQVSWGPAAGLPAVVREQIDYNDDGKADFEIALNTASGATELKALNSSVFPRSKTYRLRDGWAIRVGLKRS